MVFLCEKIPTAVNVLYMARIMVVGQLMHSHALRLGRKTVFVFL